MNSAAGILVCLYTKNVRRYSCKRLQVTGVPYGLLWSSYKDLDSSIERIRIFFLEVQYGFLNAPSLCSNIARSDQ